MSDHHIHCWERDPDHMIEEFIKTRYAKLEVLCTCGEMILLRSNGAAILDELQVWVDPFFIGFDGLYVLDPFLEHNHG